MEFEPENSFNENVIVTELNTFTQLDKISTKILRKRFINFASEKITSTELGKIHGIEPKTIDPQTIFNQIQIFNHSSRVRYDTYRFIMGKIFTNEKLKKMKLVESSICDRCTKTETLHHMVFECEKVREIWNQFESFIWRKLNIEIEIGYNSLFFGVKGKHEAIINKILYYILHKIIRSKAIGEFSKGLVEIWISEIVKFELNSFYINFKENKRSKLAKLVQS